VTTSDQTTDKRVCFDFEVDFSNGGGIQGQGFRLDLDADDINDEALAEYIIKDLRLLMVGEVRISNKQIINERHKRRAGAAVITQGAARIDLIDLSHPVRDGEVVFPGLPAPIITEHMSHEASRGRYAPDVTFQIGRVDMVANTGTSIDAPFHRYPGRMDVAGLPLASIADVDAVVIRLAGMKGRAITHEAIAATEMSGRAVLLDTGQAVKWGTPAYTDASPYLSRDGAEYLRDNGAVLVGIDAINIDDTRDAQRPAHSILLEAGIPIVENLARMSSLSSEGLRFSAAPMRIVGIGAFPVRAWARVLP
jgi:arylformamidase